jgi:hypothetical protein
VSTFEGHEHGVNACAVTADGQYLISGSEDTTVKVWGIGKPDPPSTLDGHAGKITACAVTSDGRHVVASSDDWTLNVWELGSGRIVAVLVGHTDWVNACALTPDDRYVISASEDKTLKVWTLEGRSVATLEGHSESVWACTVTPDGRHVISASTDRTLKVWELATFTCRITHRGDGPYRAVAASASMLVAGDVSGGVCFLDWPSPNRERLGMHEHLMPNPAAPPPGRALKRALPHTILYVAANPQGTDRLALDEECAAIERELRMAPGRDDFVFRSKWAVSIDELMRHLNEFQPTILHVSAHGRVGEGRSPSLLGCSQLGAADTGGRNAPREVIQAGRAGIFLQDGQSSQYVDDRALMNMIASASAPTRVVVLNACYSAEALDLLRSEIDCVIGMDGMVADAAARAFAVAFYRALAHRRSVGNAVEQAVAALGATHPGVRPVCVTRDGLRAEQTFLAPEHDRVQPVAPSSANACSDARVLDGALVSMEGVRDTASDR